MSDATADAPPADPPAGPPTQPVQVAPSALPPVREDAPAGRRRRLPLVAGVIGLAGLVAVGVFVFQGLGGSSGGASSPEAAVRQLAEALSNEDPIAALEVLVPGEVSGMDDLYGRAADRVEEAGFAGKGGPTGGLELDVENLELKVEDLGDDAARVSIDRANVTYGIDPEGLSDRVRAAAETLEERSGSFSADDAVAEVYDRDGNLQELEPFVVVVKDGGGWYVSPFHTVTQYLVEMFDLPNGDFDEGGAEQSGDSPEGPEASLTELVEAVGDLDVEGVSALIAEDQAALLQVYSDAIDELLEEVRADIDVSLDQVEVTEEEMSGGRRKLLIEGFEGSAEWSDDEGNFGSVEVDFDGECLEFSGESDSGTTCIPDEFSERTGISTPFLVMERDGDTYRLDLVGTAMEYLRVVVDTVETDVVLAATGAYRYVAPTAALEVGKPLEATLTEGGFGVYSVTAEAGELVSVGVEADDVFVDLELVDDAGQEIDELCCAGNIFRPEDAGTYRLIVKSEELEPSEITLFRGGTRESNGDAPGALSGDIEPAEIVSHAMNVGPGDDRFAISGDVDYIVLLEDGSTDNFCERSSPCALRGTKVLAVGGTESGSYRLDVERAPRVAFAEGGTTVTGFAGVSASSYELEVNTDRQVVITLQPTSPTADLVLTVIDPNGEDFSQDSGYSGDAETIVVGGVTGTYQVLVRAYGANTGPFNLTATER